MSFDLPTFLFQAINFLVLVVILWRLLFKPLRAHMAARSARIEAQLTEIERGKQEVSQARAETVAALKSAHNKERDAVRGAEAAAEARRAQILEEARRDAAKERDRLLAQAMEETAEREREFLRRLGPSVSRLLARVLAEIADDALLHERLSERFAGRLSAMSDDERARVESAAESGPVELVVASEKTPRALREAVAGLLPGADRVSVRVDQALIAGAMLRVGELVFDGSVHAQLRRALAEAA